METKVFNYRIVIEPDEETGSGKPGYVAYCPTLGIADDGDTVEEAFKNIKTMVEFHLQCLAEEEEEIPTPDEEQSFITNLKVELPARYFSSP